MHKDWLFAAENGICHFRIGAVLIRDNKLLVMCDNGEYALPGGHVSFGEISGCGEVKKPIIFRFTT